MISHNITYGLNLEMIRILDNVLYVAGKKSSSESLRNFVTSCFCTETEW